MTNTETQFGGFRGFAGFRVFLDDGRQLFVKIVSRDSWAALLPVRLYRAARFRDVGQDRNRADGTHALQRCAGRVLVLKGGIGL